MDAILCLTNEEMKKLKDIGRIEERVRCKNIILDFKRFASCTPEQISEALDEEK